MSELSYHNILESIYKNGNDTQNRTGVNSRSIFSPPNMVFDLEDGQNFPLLTKKKVNFDAVLKELLWFISGSTNINDLDSKIWDQWATEDGNIGKMYGYQLRRKEKIEFSLHDSDNKILFANRVKDQLQDVIDNIKNNPSSRRHVITLWDCFDLPDESKSPQQNVLDRKMALACCHGTVIQFYVNGCELSMFHYQRSADFPLGVPFNIASYALLLIMVARVTGLRAHRMTFGVGDAHIYHNQFNAVEEYLNREILEFFPEVEVPVKSNINDYKFEDFTLKNYNPQGFIKTEVNV